MNSQAGRPSQNPNRPMVRFRKKRNLSMKELAGLLGVTEHSVASIESGRLKMSDRLSARLMLLESQPSEVREVLESKVQAYREKLYKDAGIPL